MNPARGLLLAGLLTALAQGQPPAPPPGLRQLLTAYPDQLAAVESNAIIWQDGTRMVFDDGRRVSDPELRLDQPSLMFQLEEAYPKGEEGIPPTPNADPGRVRYLPFFQKMYGATPREVERQLISVHWLAGRSLRVTRVNGVDRQVRAVAEELEQLPPTLRRFVERPAGAYAWRTVAGTHRPSAHAFGIAVDIDASASDYWRWAGPRGGAIPTYRNRIPLEIVRIFERHGFIWGGKWSHFDTMHFEYRPELLVP